MSEATPKKKAAAPVKKTAPKANAEKTAPAKKAPAKATAKKATAKKAPVAPVEAPKSLWERIKSLLGV